MRFYIWPLTFVISKLWFQLFSFDPKDKQPNKFLIWIIIVSSDCCLRLLWGVNKVSKIKLLTRFWIMSPGKTKMGDQVTQSWVRQSMVQHLHLSSQIHESWWTYTSEMSGSVVHFTKLKIINENVRIGNSCWGSFYE